MADHSHDHSHGHHSHHANIGADNKRRLGIVFVMTAVFMVVEFIGGYLTGSLALMSDAAHMLTDTAALGLSFFAIWISSRPASQDKTFGYLRFEILAALINGMILIMLSLVIFHEAYERISNPSEVKSLPMLIVAFIGLVVNLIGAYLLIGGAKSNLNVRGALFHVMGDALGSVGAIVAGVIMLYTGWYYADPIVSFAIAAIIIIGALKLVKDSANIILEASPAHIDLSDLEGTLCRFEGVKDVHELHVWTIASGFESLSAHIVLEDHDSGHGLVEGLADTLKEKFNIEHVTIQLEDTPCMGAGDSICKLPIGK